MYVIRFEAEGQPKLVDPEVQATGLQAYALRKAKRAIDQESHRSLRQGMLFECARCGRAAHLQLDDAGFRLVGPLSVGRCR
jgi:hypothetical protein